MMNCQEATRLLSEQQERTLSVKETMALKMHTAMCSACRNFGKQMDMIRGFARSYAKQESAKQESVKQESVKSETAKSESAKKEDTPPDEKEQPR